MDGRVCCCNSMQFNVVAICTVSLFDHTGAAKHLILKSDMILPLFFIIIQLKSF